MQIRLEFKPQDLWIGVFWKTTRCFLLVNDIKMPYVFMYDVWICIVPMLPIHLIWYSDVQKEARDDG